MKTLALLVIGMVLGFLMGNNIKGPSDILHSIIYYMGERYRVDEIKFDNALITFIARKEK